MKRWCVSVSFRILLKRDFRGIAQRIVIEQKSDFYDRIKESRLKIWVTKDGMSNLNKYEVQHWWIYD